MRRPTLLCVALAAALTVAGPVAAQRQPREGTRTGAAATSGAAATASDSPNPVKRTWDFTKRFGIPRFAARDCASGAGELAAFLAAYNAQVDRFLAGPTDPKKLGLERRNFTKQVEGTARDIAAYNEAFATTGQRSPDSYVPPLEDDICRAAAQRHALLAVRAGLAAMARVYPDMAEVAPRLAEAEAALAGIGDDAALRKRVLANREAALAMVRMKPLRGTISHGRRACAMALHGSFRARRSSNSISTAPTGTFIATNSPASRNTARSAHGSARAGRTRRAGSTA